MKSVSILRQFFVLSVSVAFLFSLNSGKQEGLFNSNTQTASADTQAPLVPVGNGFTYQGKLNSGGSPVNDLCDFLFNLWDAQSGGTQVGGSIETLGAAVNDGMFTVLLDFGASAFAGEQRWLEIAVRCPSGSGTYLTLGRQEITPTPYAINANTLDGQDSSAFSLQNHNHWGQVWTGGAGTALQLGSGYTDQIRFESAIDRPKIEFGNSYNTYMQYIFGGGGGYVFNAWSGTGEWGRFTINGNTKMRLTADGRMALGNINQQAWFGEGLYVNSGDIRTEGKLISSVGQGTPPLQVSSTTQVNNLNADLLDGQHSSDLQQRVNGACAVGSTIQTINSDGSVVCEEHDAKPGFSISNLGNAIGGVSTAIGSDGLLLITFIDSRFYLMTAHCSDLACTSASRNTIDPTFFAGGQSSIAIGADGLGLISYIVADDFRIAHCSNVECSSATITVLENITGGWGSSVAIGVDGLGLIAYHDGNLKVAHCSNTNCTAATITTLDSHGGETTGLTITADGLGLISYRDGSGSYAMKTAHCSNLECTSATITTHPTTANAGVYTALATASDGLGLFVFNDYSYGNLKAAHCLNPTCTSVSVTTLSDQWSSGNYVALTIGADGFPIASSYDGNNGDLLAAHCSDAACSTASVVVSDGNLGTYGHNTSITIGVDGMPLVSYCDYNSQTLKAAHCSNVFCLPYFQRR